MPSPGFFELYPSIRPALPAGAYLLAADHDLVATPPQNANGQMAVDGSDFTVKIISPRYTMPPDQILSTFPPAGAVGDWRERLPQIVFKRRTLPWERNPNPAAPFGDNTPPWLALVVLAEAEGALSPEVDVSQCVTPGRQLAGDADTARGRYLEVRNSIVQRIFPTIEDLGLLTHVRKVDLSDTELALGDDDGYLAVVVGNRLPQPGPPAAPGGPATSLRYTAYVVNLEGQLDLLPTEEVSGPVLDFKVSMPELQALELLARPPDAPLDVMVMQGPPALLQAGGRGDADGPKGTNATPARAAASVTSFGAAAGVEAASAGFSLGPAVGAVVSDDAARSARRWATGESLADLAGASGFLEVVYQEPTHRFPVLLSWDFVCTGEGGFERLMNELGSGMLGTGAEDADPALQPEVAVTGHISLSHRSRRGEPTQSWYRGPLVPQPTARTLPKADGTLPLAHTGDQLRRVVPDGHEDVGLAAAFEIGRLLALSKPGFVAAVAAWREELFGAARAQAIGGELVEDVLPGFGQALVEGKRRLEDLLATDLLLPYAAQVPDAVGPQVREFATARVPDDIDELSAFDAMEGLGLSLDEVARVTDQLGIGGLGTIAVEVAEFPTGPLSEAPAEVGLLRSTLDAHLDDLVTDALELEVIVDTERTGRRPDDLDRLLGGSRPTGSSSDEEA